MVITLVKRKHGAAQALSEEQTTSTQTYLRYDMLHLISERINTSILIIKREMVLSMIFKTWNHK